jgi:hypothetical protein
MQSLLFWLFVLFGPALAIAALYVSSKNESFHAEDLVTLVSPPLLFNFAAAVFGRDVAVGAIIWPIIIWQCACYLVALKVALLDLKWPEYATVSSRTLLFLSCFVASVLALLVPPWRM